MNSEVPSKYLVYELWSYFAEPPGELLCCPACEGPVSIKTIGPSKAASKYYPQGYLHLHQGYGYQCKSCPWWAVRETWMDYELNIDPDYLVVGESDGHQESSPWVQLLEDKDLYDQPKPLPDTIGKWFSHAKKRK